MIRNKSENKIKRSIGEKIFDSTNVIVLLIFCVITLYPFWYVLINSLNEGTDATLGGLWLWPRKFTLDNYIYVLNNAQLKLAYLITILRTVLGAAICLLITGIAAYAISKRNLIGRSFILGFFILPMFIGGTVVSNYIIIAKLHLLNKFLVYIIPGAFSFFFMIVIRTFIYGLPPSLEESAKIDGAGYFVIFFKIILPLCRPVVATLLLFSGVGYWLDFNTNLLYVSNNKLMTLQYLLYMVTRANQMSVLQEQMALSTGNIAALKAPTVTPEAIKMTILMVITLPILCIYPFLQKYFINGMMIGAIKE